ncbi:golgin subfamily A member 6B-like, partial [Piliocolobus tephrosceles]|uniref:Golgin subfamily A member 6B-like n=1 Tax=Piliocolobus tephrosceles TaxID=591936 RepID=A0A8C9H1H7_9PRIM
SFDSSTSRDRHHKKIHQPGGSAKDAALGEEDIIRLAQDQETQVNLLELQGQVLWLVGDHNEGHDKFLTTAQSPADEPTQGAPIPQELGSADKQGDLWDVSLTDSVEPAPGEAREGSPHHNPTAQLIVQLLPLMQDSPGAPRLGQQPLHAILFGLPRTGR